MAKWNPFAKRGHEIGISITASARVIKIKDADDVNKWVRKVEEWQKRGWAYYDVIGQLKYGVNFLANASSKVRLTVARFDPAKPSDDPVEITDGRASEALDRLRDGLGSHAELIRRAIVNLSVPGEFYIVGIEERREERPVDPMMPTGLKEEVVTVPQTWGLYSTEEVTKAADGKLKLRTSGEEGAEAKDIDLDEDNDFVLRIWMPHARFADKPDSPVRGILTDAEDITDLRAMMRACDQSRTTAGLFLFPTEETAGLPDPTQTPTEGGDERQDPVMKLIEDAATAAIENPDGVDRVAPTTLRVSMANIDGPRHIDWGRKVTADDLERWDKLQQSLEQGMPVPVGTISGVKDVNHWGAWQIDESTFTGHVEPLILVLCASLTSGYLRPFLTAEDGDGQAMSEDEASNYVIWYDPTALVKDPDPTKTANEAFDKFAISWEAYRKRLGILDDEAPDDAELAMRMGFAKGAVEPGAVLALLQMLMPGLVPSPDSQSGMGGFPPGDGDGEEPAEPEEGPPPAEEPENGEPPDGDARALTAASQPRRAGRDLGARLKNIDRDLRLRLHTSWQSSMKRALDRAGAKALSSIPNGQKRALGLGKMAQSEVFAALGKDRVKAFGLDEERVLEGAFDSLEPEFRSWVGRAQQKVLGLVPRLPEHRRAAAEARMEDDIEDAWQTAQPALMALARKRLYDPQPEEPKVGESEAGTLVPFGMVRAVVAIAGGSKKPGTWVGVGSGPTITGLMEEQGVRAKGYVWDYGDFPRTNGFEPHEQLDGVEFENFDDEVLANPNSWPDVAFYQPGDHDGSVVAGTVVEGLAPSAMSLRWYEGRIVELATASGQLLAVTPNHPVLTDRGWVEAQFIMEGDHVVRSLDTQRAANLVPDQYQTPARVENLFAAGWVSDRVRPGCVPVAPKDFHGDGVGSEVAVVWADRDLRIAGKSPFAQPLLQPDLGRASGTAQRLASARSAFQGLPAIGSSTLGLKGEGSDAPTFLGGSPAVDESLRVAHAAWRDPGEEEPLVDRAASHAVTLGQGLGGLTGLVQLDKVIEINSRSGFSGHVFDLHTLDRWYVANSLIVHNCVCDFEQILEDTGAQPIAASASSNGTKSGKSTEVARTLAAQGTGGN